MTFSEEMRLETSLSEEVSSLTSLCTPYYFPELHFWTKKRGKSLKAIPQLFPRDIHTLKRSIRIVNVFAVKIVRLPVAAFVPTNAEELITTASATPIAYAFDSIDSVN